ncbi:hypothetical protein C8R46DRAFT_1031395 [Mycena filopes]|nr:hypothetical protein C8R46DRAFT_1031395 [Mycena filopes]
MSRLRAATPAMRRRRVGASSHVHTDQQPPPSARCARRALRPQAPNNPKANHALEDNSLNPIDFETIAWYPRNILAQKFVWPFIYVVNVKWIGMDSYSIHIPRIWVTPLHAQMPMCRVFSGRAATSPRLLMGSTPHPEVLMPSISGTCCPIQVLIFVVCHTPGVEFGGASRRRSYQPSPSHGLNGDEDHRPTWPSL